MPHLQIGYEVVTALSSTSLSIDHLPCVIATLIASTFLINFIHPSMQRNLNIGDAGDAQSFSSLTHTPSVVDLMSPPGAEAALYNAVPSVLPQAPINLLTDSDSEDEADYEFLPAPYLLDEPASPEGNDAAVVPVLGGGGGGLMAPQDNAVVDLLTPVLQAVIPQPVAPQPVVPVHNEVVVYAAGAGQHGAGGAGQQHLRRITKNSSSPTQHTTSRL